MEEDNEMTGAFVPYQLRQNKAVDRQLFIDLLSMINRHQKIQDYLYVSFGGPYLEDFKLLHATFNSKHLISLEKNRIAFGRQKFNLPLDCIQCLELDSGRFIDSYESATQAIFWLDYAEADKRREQVQEFQSLLGKARQYDIVKVTLNANPDSLVSHTSTDSNGDRESKEVRNEKRFEILSHKMGDYLPPETSPEMMTADDLPRVLIKSLQYAANLALSERAMFNEYFQILSAHIYNDTPHQMLTLAGIILDRQDKESFLSTTGLNDWEHAILTWNGYHKINVPALTAREKLFIDQLLPSSTSEQIQEKLQFLFHQTPSKSLAIIESYKKHYRHYPSFHRVAF